jgi:hypothetical protein
MLKEELDNVEEIVLAILSRSFCNRPEIPLSDGKQDFKIWVSNITWDKSSVYALVAERLVEIAVLTHLVENSDKKVYDVAEGQAIRMRVQSRAL